MEARSLALLSTHTVSNGWLKLWGRLSPVYDCCEEDLGLLGSCLQGPQNPFQ